MTESRKHLRGFASMNPERRRELGSKGGRAVPPEQRMFFQDRNLASAAGKIGGLSSPQNKTVSRTAGEGRDGKPEL